MANRKIKRLLQEAVQAYRQGDRKTGSQLISQVLQEDFTNSETWELLYRLYGRNQPLADFQREFAARYYPDDAYKLAQGAGDAPPQAQKRLPFFKALFQRFWRKQAQAVVEVPPVPAWSEVDAPLSTPPPGAKHEPAAPASPATQPVELAPKSAPGLGLRPPAPTGKIRILVVDDIAITRENIIRALEFQENFEVVGTATDGQEGVRLARELRPDVVIMDVNMPGMDGITATALIRRAQPATQVVMLTVQDDVDYIRRSMLAGARDFLAKPPMIEELAAAVERAGGIAHQEKTLQPETAEAQRPVHTYTGGRILTVYSPRGGAGCTTLAVNLAAALQDAGHSSVVVDGNLQFGDVPVLLNERPTYSIRDLAPRAAELDEDLVNEVLGKHPSGLRLLAPPRPEQAEIVTSEQLGQIIRFLCQDYEYILIDTAHQLNEITLAALDLSHLVLLVTSQDIPSIAKVRRFLELAPSLGLGPDRILILMNQYSQRVGIQPEKVALSFQQPIAAVIPLDRDTTINSINRGEPFMLSREALGRPLGQGVLKLIESLQSRLEEQGKTNEGLI